MEFIFMLVGAIVGAAVDRILEKRISTCGVIEVDHNTEQCKIHITSDELSKRNTKKAIFKVNHDATISREEQIL